MDSDDAYAAERLGLNAIEPLKIVLDLDDANCAYQRLCEVEEAIAALQYQRICLRNWLRHK